MRRAALTLDDAAVAVMITEVCSWHARRPQRGTDSVSWLRAQASMNSAGVLGSRSGGGGGGVMGAGGDSALHADFPPDPDAAMRTSVAGLLDRLGLAVVDPSPMGARVGGAAAAAAAAAAAGWVSGGDVCPGGVGRGLGGRSASEWGGGVSHAVDAGGAGSAAGHPRADHARAGGWSDWGGMGIGGARRDGSGAQRRGTDGSGSPAGGGDGGEDGRLGVRCDGLGAFVSHRERDAVVAADAALRRVYGDAGDGAHDAAGGGGGASEWDALVVDDDAFTGAFPQPPPPPPPEGVAAPARGRKRGITFLGDPLGSGHNGFDNE